MKHRCASCRSIYHNTSERYEAHGNYCPTCMLKITKAIQSHIIEDRYDIIERVFPKK